MKKLTNKQIEEMFNDPVMLQWERSNQWFGKDEFLSEEAMKIHKVLMDKEKIDTDSLPAKNILQSELNTEKRKFDNIGPINFRAENEANETNKKIIHL